jgi:hypothetical protein
MESTLDTDSGATDAGSPGFEASPPPKGLSRALKTYAFLLAVIVGVAVGAAFRFVPATAAATPDDSAGPASTACAAQ